MSTEKAKTAEKTPLKNLSSKQCKPTEFISQTVKIKKIAAEWLKNTDFFDILSIGADLVKITDDMPDDEKEKALKKNQELNLKTAKEKLLKMFEAVFEKDPENTLKLLAMACFIEPEDVDSHTMSEYFTALSEMLNDESAIGFFISFIRLASLNI